MDYNQLVTINYDIFIIKQLLANGHAEEESANLYLELIKKYNLSKKFDLDSNFDDKLKQIQLLLEHDIDIFYEQSYFNKNLSLPQSEKVKGLLFRVKHLKTTLKSNLMNMIVLLFAIGITLCNYFFVDKGTFLYDMLFAVSTGLFASWLFDVLTNFRKSKNKELSNDKKRTISDVKNLQNLLLEDYENLVKNKNIENLKFMILVYMKIYKQIGNWSRTTDYKSCPINVNLNLFLNFYNDNFKNIDIDKLDLDTEIINKCITFFPTVKELLDNIRTMNGDDFEFQNFIKTLKEKNDGKEN